MLILALKHKTKNANYLLIEDGLPSGKVKVISPSGELILINENMFLGDPFELPAQLFLGLPEMQREKYNEALKEKEDQEQIELERKHQREHFISQAEKHLSVQDEQGTPSPIKRTHTSKRNSKSERAATSTIRVEWQGSSLIFYKHKIDPLPPKGHMIISIGADKYRLTKSDFERIFNDVIMSSQYRNAGHFHFAELPTRILPFKIS